MPKSRIQNDNADAINIVNGEDSDVQEDDLIKEVVNLLTFFPPALREHQLDILLSYEAYQKIAKKKDKILRSME